MSQKPWCDTLSRQLNQMKMEFHAYARKCVVFMRALRFFKIWSIQNQAEQT